MAKRLPKYRKFPDGTLVAPKRGNHPPPPPDGYEHSPWDQWTYIPILKPCNHRTKFRPKGCCGRIEQLRCEYADKNVNRGVCYNCDAKPEEYYGPAS